MYYWSPDHVHVTCVFHLNVDVHIYYTLCLFFHFSYSYYEYIWQRTKGRSFGSLFNGMPRALQADISLSLYKKIIDQV